MLKGAGMHCMALPVGLKLLQCPLANFIKPIKLNGTNGEKYLLGHFMLKYTQQVSVAYLNMQCGLNLLSMGVLKASRAAVIAEVERLRQVKLSGSSTLSHAGAVSMSAYCLL
ncbi:hypothetical protein AMECASPLE_004266 [Ameca splendens]|uniref:Uncharacterized protein n=1 Tax=Ameca splendens TaxID=208324 RepID=A0ABV1A7M7_9TELE